MSALPMKTNVSSQKFRVYMFHCHNLIHEDHDMMAAFNVTQLQELGYDEETDCSDPEDPRWSAVAFVQSDWTGRSAPFTQQAINVRIRETALQQPYSEQAQVEAALAAAWADGSAQKRSADEGCKDQASGTISRVRRFIV
jgi:bilirubin oxidase